jgi:NAD+ synthase
MTDRLSIAAVQANPVMGAIERNAARAAELIATAHADGADLAVFPELYLIGYPPEDLALKPAAVRDCKWALERLAAQTAGLCPALVSLMWPSGGPRPHNAYALIADGEIRDVTFKVDLPNYGVFDEKRVFAPGAAPKVFDFRGVKLGVPVCEDIWGPIPCAALKAQGAEILITPNGSPFRRTAADERLEIVRARSAESGLPMIYVNQVGGQDELVFDGASFAVQADGEVCMRLPAFEEATRISTWRRTGGSWRCEDGPAADWRGGPEALYRAMVLGLKDYVDKSGFPGVLLGLSGGIDSALTAAVAVDALGPERVRCVMLPSRYTSRESLEDAEACARALGAPYESIGIEPAVDAFGGMLAGAFAGRAPDATEENIQSRARAVTLMALSNKTGWMLVTTGNKSEMAVGYATLYGDMCGGFNVLKDLYKTEVYEVARWRNGQAPAPGGRTGVIPGRIIAKAPSAELRPDQTDQDSLPPYEVLDGILHGLVEEEATADEITGRGFDAALVRRVQNLLYGAEYKRRQAPPGVKLGARAFGRDRRYPIVNGYRDNGDR